MSPEDEILLQKINFFPNITVMSKEEKQKFLQEKGLQLILYAQELYDAYLMKCSEIENLQKTLKRNQLDLELKEKKRQQQNLDQWY